MSHIPPSTAPTAQAEPSQFFDGPIVPLWYAVHCRPNFEFDVAAHLDALRLETYLPAVEEIHQWSDRKKVVKVPVFPGYVLVRFGDAPGARTPILRTHGVLRILGHGRSIEPIPDHQVDAVRRMLDGSTHCEGHPLIKEGTRVRVTRGALKGLEGLMVRIKNKNRFVVSVELLGRSISAEIDANDASTVPAICS